MSIYDNVAYGPRTHGIKSRVLLDDIVERSLRDAAIWDEVKDRLKKSALGEGTAPEAGGAGDFTARICEKERGIEAMCMWLLLQQPVAKDLRVISSALKMVTSLERARAVIAYDDVVDEHFDRAKRQLIGYLGRPGADGEYALDLLMIAKYFERIGDHATNIAGWVAFSILGHHVGKHEG